jgi:hypothetical protein
VIVEKIQKVINDNALNRKTLLPSPLKNAVDGGKDPKLGQKLGPTKKGIAGEYHKNSRRH